MAQTIHPTADAALGCTVYSVQCTVYTLLYQISVVVHNTGDRKAGGQVLTEDCILLTEDCITLTLVLLHLS